MIWVFVCLIAGVTAEVTGPGIGAVHLIALGVAAIAFLMILWPDRPGIGAGYAESDRPRGLLGASRSTRNR